MFKKLALFLSGIAIAAGAWSQIPISNLPNAQLPLQPSDQVIVDQNAGTPQKVTRKATVANFTSLAPSINSTYILVTPDVTIPNSRVLGGTANEVILTDGGAQGTLTLSTPQPIGTLNTPTFAGLTINGAISAQSLSLTTPLPPTSGGTGFASYTIGDILSASSTTALTRINDVAVGSYLRSGGVGTLPLWSTLVLPNAATTGDLITATGTNVLGSLADVAAGSFLRSGGVGAAPVWSTVTIPNSLTTGDILMATATNTVGVRADVAAGSYLRSGGVGAVPIYSTTTIPNTSVLGDLWYGSAANVVSALAGNTTTTKQFLTQTGTGVVSAAPIWGTIQASDLPGSFSGFANPSGLIGLTAVNGVATTATRSDATHALDQSIAPTWTSNHIWSQSANSILTPATVINTNAGTAAGAQIALSNASRSVVFLYTGTGYTGNPLSISTGEQADIYTNGAFPLNLGVNTAARMSMNNAVAGRQVDIVGTTNSNSALGYIGFVDQAGTRYGYVGKASTGTTITLDSDAQLTMTGNNGVDTLVIDTGHTLNYNGLYTVNSSAMLYTAGPIRTQQGVTANTGSGTPVTIFTMPSTTLITTYLVSCFLATANDINNYGAVALVSGSTSVSKVTNIQTAALMTITTSGLNIQCTQGSGAANVINYAALRWGNI